MIKFYLTFIRNDHILSQKLQILCYLVYITLFVTEIVTQKLFVESSQTQCLLKLRFQFREFEWQTLSSYYVQHELFERYTVNSSKSAKARKFKHTIIGHGASVTIFSNTGLRFIGAKCGIGCEAKVLVSLKEQHSFSQKIYLCFHAFRRKIFSEYGTKSMLFANQFFILDTTFRKRKVLS